MFKILFLTIFMLLPYKDYEWVKQHGRTSAMLAQIMWLYEPKKDVIDSDEWQTPELAVSIGSFDCEEGAAIVYDILTSHGYDCTIYLLHSDDGERIGHVICYYNNWDGDEGYFSNTNRYKMNPFIIDEVCEKYEYTDWEIKYIKWWLK